MASLTYVLPVDQIEEFTVYPRIENDLPEHIKGTAYWVVDEYEPRTCYNADTKHGPIPVEFINNQWYWLEWREHTGRFVSRGRNQLAPRTWGLGQWRITDPQHPDYAPTYEPEDIVDTSSDEIIEVTPTRMEAPVTTF